MIALTGATGQLGHYVLQDLLNTVPASQIVAIVRNPAKAQALSQQGWPQLTLVRPSLLIGERARPRLAERLAAPLLRYLPGNLQAIEASVLARALWRLALEQGDGLRIVESAELRRLGR